MLVTFVCRFSGSAAGILNLPFVCIVVSYFNFVHGTYAEGCFECWLLGMLGACGL